MERCSPKIGDASSGPEMRTRRGVIFGALVSAEMERRGVSERLSHRPDNRVASRPRLMAESVMQTQFQGVAAH